MPRCNSEAMSMHLEEIAFHVAPGAHAVLLLDQAGWHGSAELFVPENRHNAIAATLNFADAHGTPIHADFDWRHGPEELWKIEVQTQSGMLRMAQGGKILHIDGKQIDVGPEREYPGLYERFQQLVANGESDVDVSPLQHVADAMLLGDRHLVEAFND